MATIIIVPINTKTKGGYDAEITGIAPSNEDCLVGKVNVPHGNQERSWNASGICRDSPEELNICPSESAVTDVIETVKAITK